MSITISIIPKTPGPVPNPNLWRILTDKEIGRTNRPHLPMVWVWSAGVVKLTREWQYALRAWNPGMEPRRISAVLDNNKAFTNTMGFGDSSDPRRNWLMGENLDAPADPGFDKVRSSGAAVVEIVNGVVTMMDGNSPPLLKPGVSQPGTLADATFEKYLYNPRDNPHLFFACMTTGNDFDEHPFPYGALYPWYKNGKVPVTFLPHVAPGPVVYPPKAWTDNTPQLVKI